jgi:hypothetical protein
MRVFIFCLLLVSAGLPLLHADDPDRLFIRPWTELEPLVRIEPGPYPIPVNVAEKTLLEQARVLLSGMVYGWSFFYVPGDKARRVEESFVLTPLAQIPWGNPRLRAIETEVAETRLWGRFSYALDDQEKRRRASWDSNIAALSTGQGTAALQHGAGAREEALESAIRDAIRRSLDTRYLNKPREVTGELVLWTDPLVVARSGTYTTTATIKVMVRDLVPYRIF